MENILFLLAIDEGQQLDFQQRFPQAHFTFTDKTSVTKEQLAEATIIIGNPPVGLLSDQLTNLKWLQLNSAGYDEYLQPGVLPPQTILSNARGTYGLTVSEHALSLCLMLMRKLHLYLRDQLSHDWAREGRVKSVFGSRVGVVGLGDIGHNVATRFYSLGATVIGYDIDSEIQLEEVAEVRPMTTIGETVADLDVLILCAPATAETHHLVDTSLLNQAKADLILINVGRGDLVDTPALIAHMEKNSDFMAALDVIDPEPLPKDSPYWDVHNLVLTPHVAGGFHLDKTKELFLEIAAGNLKAFFTEPAALQNVIRRDS